jgi:hypothetical protein
MAVSLRAAQSEDLLLLTPEAVYSGCGGAGRECGCGLPLDRIPDAIARTVQLAVDDLQAAACDAAQKHAAG